MGKTTHKIALKSIVEDTNTLQGRIFNYSIQILIVISLISFSIDTLPNLSETTRLILRLTEVSTVMIFTVEYLLRIYVIDKKSSYIFSFYGIVDLLAILPFYITSGVDLRALRYEEWTMSLS